MGKNKNKNKKNKKNKKRKIPRQLHFQRGRISFQMGDYVAAIKAWQVAAKEKNITGIEGKLAEAHFRQALTLNRSSETSQIILQLQNAIKLSPKTAIYHYHLGLVHHRQRAYLQAIEAYQHAIRLSPDNPRFQRHLTLALAESGQEPQPQDPLIKIIVLLHQEKYRQAHSELAKCGCQDLQPVLSLYICAMQGKYAKAKKLFTKNLPPTHVRIMAYYLGLIYALENKLPSAIKHLETAMKDCALQTHCIPILLDVYKRQAHKYKKGNDADKAKSLYNKIAQLNPQSAESDNAITIALEEGYQYIERKDFGKALQIWRRLINKGVNHPLLLQNYAVACDHNEDYVKAIQAWKQLALLWEPLANEKDNELLSRKLALVYRRIGELATMIKDIDQAKTAYESALRYSPQDIDIHLRLIVLDFEEDNFGQGLRQLKKLHEKYPQDIRILELMTTAYLDVEDFAKALQSALAILKLQPKHENARDLLRSLGGDYARNLCEQNKQHVAMRLLLECIEIDPEYLAFYTQLAGIYINRKRPNQALKLINQCLERAKDKERAHAEVGSVYLKAFLFEEAEEHFKKAGGLKSENPGVLIAIVAAYIIDDEMRKANRYLKRLFSVQPNDPQVIVEIVDRLMDAGEEEQALELLQKVVKKFPRSRRILMGLIALGMRLEDFDIVQKTIPKMYAVASEKEDYEILQMLDMLEMIFRSGWGDFLW